MIDLVPVYTRILLRYGVGAIAAYALLPDWLVATIQDDPDVALVVGSIVAALVEGWYRVAKGKGGAT